jgi:hypothetical protein
VSTRTRGHTASRGAAHHSAHSTSRSRAAAKRKHAVAHPAPKPTDPLAPGPGRAGHIAGGQRVHIFALSRSAQVTALLGDQGARITAGYGKWEEIAVPRGQPFTQWVGGTLLAMDVALILDGYRARRSVEPEVKALEEMAIPAGPRPPGEAPVTPSPIRMVGAVPHTDLTWVVAGIDYGDVIRDHPTGHRLRQALTLKLMEYREEETIGALGVAGKAGGAPRKVKVKKGDNLKKLAAHYLGKSSRWPEIVKLNKGLRGWKLPTKLVGKTILVPGH